MLEEARIVPSCTNISCDLCSKESRAILITARHTLVRYDTIPYIPRYILLCRYREMPYHYHTYFLFERRIKKIYYYYFCSWVRYVPLSSSIHNNIQNISSQQDRVLRMISFIVNILNARNLFTRVRLTVTHAGQMSRPAFQEDLELFVRLVGLKSEVNQWLTWSQPTADLKSTNGWLEVNQWLTWSQPMVDFE